MEGIARAGDFGIVDVISRENCGKCPSYVPNEKTREPGGHCEETMRRVASEFSCHALGPSFCAAAYGYPPPCSTMVMNEVYRNIRSKNPWFEGNWTVNGKF